jgi:hypothetical protein
MKQKYLVMRWGGSGGMSFKDFADLRLDGIKVVGAANATGLLSLAAFLASGSSKTVAAIMAAKICILIFTGGIVAFAMSYFQMYGWRSSVDDSLAMFSKVKKLENPEIEVSLEQAGKHFNAAAICFLVSIACLVLGGSIITIGILVLY